MRNTAVVLMLSLFGTPVPWGAVGAATDGVYGLSEVPATWDGTHGDRLATSTPDYDYTYGDEAALTYTLPWSFTYYGVEYREINIDTNGNIWFTGTGSSHSFNLANTGRGPVISAWNEDLSSHYFGGAFVQHKTDPERVVVEWYAEDYREEAYYFMNNFEVVLFPTGTARVDYKAFATEIGRDLGSGFSNGTADRVVSITSAFGKVHTLAGRSFSFAAVAPAATTRGVTGSR